MKADKPADKPADRPRDIPLQRILMLLPMLREALIDEDDIDLNHVVLSHYRLSAIRQQDLKINEDVDGYQLEPGEGLGTAKARDIKEEFLSQSRPCWVIFPRP